MESQPLRLVLRPLEWQAYDLLEEGRGIRVFYGHSPSEAVADLVLSESAEIVAITLFERSLEGVYPDGSVPAKSAVGTASCLEVRLDERVAERRIIDGSTGRATRLRALDAPEGTLDRFFSAALERGCPRWIR